MIVIVSTINVLISSLIYFNYDKKVFYEDTKQKLEILARVVGENNSATILFNKPKEAKENLQTLKADEHIEIAQIIVKKKLFVSYKKNENIDEVFIPITPYSDTVIFLKEKALVNAPLHMDNDTIAEIRIQYSTKAIQEKLQGYYKIIALIFFVTLFVASVLAYFFQKNITRPIFELYKLMNIITEKKDYSLRSGNMAKDEIGQLSNGFNQMLDQIEEKNNELSYQKELAEASLKAKERFLANMTHELRTPLNSIIGLTGLLHDTPLNHEQINYLENIKLSSDHLLAIINDLLEFSRIGSGKLQFEENEFSIRLSVERIKNTMQYELRKRNLDFSCHVDKEVPHIVVGDDYRLNQILLNLVGNAIKFTPKGKIEIFVKKIFESEQKIGIEFRVKDTGIGIRKEKQKIIFDSFTQENDTTTREYGGTGLGLAITKQLIELQGGEIRVESEKGKGSTFIFSIPYLKKEFSLKTKENNAPKLGHLEKILLIDDNEMNLLFTKSILEKSNFVVETALNAELALEKLYSKEFNLILMDLYMPETDGFELSQKIRAIDDEKFKTIPIIALTAAATVNEINKCFAAGMNDYIIKPFKKDELISKILNLTKK
ncbi:MAG: ATP-binding protein [Bacteroidales bacterium]|nr:ATP-binding protein [Bacteroidales bacterium]